MTESEYLDKIETELNAVFDAAIDARDRAQDAIRATTALKMQLTKRRIELTTAKYAALTSREGSQ